MFQYEFDEDVVAGRSYEHLQPRLSRVDAIKTFRAATGHKSMLCSYAKNVVEYNLGRRDKYHAHQVGQLIRAWWSQNGIPA
jgi:hypothetical protein